MRRQFYYALAVICLCATALQAAQQNTEYMEQYLKDTPIHQPNLEKVFPGVEFVEQTNLRAMTPAPEVHAMFQGRKWQMPAEFNRLYNQVAKKSTATVKERMEAYVRIVYWDRDDSLQILTNDNKAIDLTEKREGCTVHNPYNYRLVVGIHIGKEIKSFEVFIYFNENKIKWATSISPEGFHFLLPDPFGLSRDYNLEVIGAQPKIYPPDPISYYNVPVSINGIM